MINALRRFLKIAGSSVINIDKRLRITVDEREPTSLDLNHQSMPAQERMINVLEGKANASRPVRLERFGAFQALAKFPPHHIAAN